MGWMFERLNIPCPVGGAVGFRVSVAMIAVVVAGDVLEKRGCCVIGATAYD